uniref:Ferredoxin-dependent glutamate synthase n=1 Tax=Dicranema revolutum TaxID=239144 RepID=A0A4D6WTS4_9FLOR|nr:glutamate synthase [Dicranema revolutum]
MQISKYFTNKLSQYPGYPYIIRERDACGVGFIAQINSLPSHMLISKAINALTCMEHRGACGSDRVSGDGSGIMTQIPWKLFMNCMSPNIIKNVEGIGVAMVFFPHSNIESLKKICEWVLEEEGLSVLVWRNVPVNQFVLGTQAKVNQPNIQQCFVRSKDCVGDDLEKKLYIIRKKIEKSVSQTLLNLNKQFYICSFSSRTIVYKGMVRSEVLGQYYLDLYNTQYESHFVLYHRRFSTNTMPKWALAQPMRFIAHNGEINTLLGNLNWMKSKEDLLIYDNWHKYYKVLKPIVNIENSDSANLDSIVELFVQSGKSPQEALMILIPEVYQNKPSLRSMPSVVHFYEYYSNLQEPWDGPALVTFSDGKIVGATLDRNGLRPARYIISKQGLISLSSEIGVFDIDSNNILEKGRLGPGQMLCVDIINNKILDDLVIKQSVSDKFPYRQWIKSYQKVLVSQDPCDDLNISNLELNRLHNAFGYTYEDLELVIEHMAVSSKEPTFCMGDDIPLAILSEKHHVLYDYFRQRFAQVTNPAIDPLRERLVMSLTMYLGPKHSFLNLDSQKFHYLRLDSPVLNEKELLDLSNYGLKVSTVSFFINQDNTGHSFYSQISGICEKCVDCVNKGAAIIILTDRVNHLSLHKVFVPPLLIVGAVHHYLISRQLRHKVSLVVETAQCWNTHHFACLIGYGASAVCPYGSLLSVRNWWNNPRTQKFMDEGRLLKTSIQQSQQNYINGIKQGLLKILSKMGISLLSSYHGAQIFEILGLGTELVDIAFIGTTSCLNGMTLDELILQTIQSYNKAFMPVLPKKLTNLGYIQYRPTGEYHVNNPVISKLLHKTVRYKDPVLYSEYKLLLDSRPPTSIRDLLIFSRQKPSIPLYEVESVEAILERFCTGGMSLGALSREAHETLAVAMNRIGGKSNSGEGGEDPIRFEPIQSTNNEFKNFSHLRGLIADDSTSSAIKQIASGRFGVTPEYLINAKQLEIKIAQGAKPGEGGQLPGKKVSSYIAKLRNCKPGVTLISPPPHHDIYSIEDLAQLIFDLHQINPQAPVSVKLVAETGIGTIAAGVAKANADIIQISGYDGGTGASPLSSIKHAGSPWELGLTEVHQALVQNGLRDRVVLRVDGGLKTGKDIVLASLMGAEEFGFGTIAMIATGCVMARICHTNNCPVGVATQKADLRKRYIGIPSDLVNFFVFIAEEVRNILADLGYRSLQNIIGLSTLLKYKHKNLYKTKNLNLYSILSHSQKLPITDFHNSVHNNGLVLDDNLLKDKNILSAIKNELNVIKNIKIYNIDRTVGARISGSIVKKYGNYGFNGNLQLNFIGCAGQSFGAFICKGMHLHLTGDANDYVGKGMNGGEIIICPIENSNFNPSEQVILGNTCLYGATGGYLFAYGKAGERFGIRNSAAQAVVEGVGDHPCEYMTGGLIVVLGVSGCNIAAGMTGGISYFLDENDTLVSKVNHEIVKVQRIITKEGEEHLKNIIELYEIKTKSSKAKKILDNWDYYLSLFWQIVPPSESSTPLTNMKFSSFNLISY